MAKFNSLLVNQVLFDRKDSFVSEVVIHEIYHDKREVLASIDGGEPTVLSEAVIKKMQAKRPYFQA